MLEKTEEVSQWQLCTGDRFTAFSKGGNLQVHVGSAFWTSFLKVFQKFKITKWHLLNLYYVQGIANWSTQMSNVALTKTLWNSDSVYSHFLEDETEIARI